MSILQKIQTGHLSFAKGTKDLLYLIALLVLPLSMTAQDRYVDPSGSDAANDCSLPGSPCLTISHAMTQAITGEDIHVAAGTYNENVLINKQVNLIGAGASVTIVQGTYTPSRLGTFHISNNTHDVSISGFHLIGYDYSSPGIEHAALYIQGLNNDITITDNRITADGEAALVTEYGYTSTNLVIDNNVFDGQTFDGSYPAGCGSLVPEMFTIHNYPRALVVINHGYTDVTFTNNTISGIAGAIDPSMDSPCDETGFGNSLVYIDSDDNTITDNIFDGTTAGEGEMLYTNGSGNSIHDNEFDGSHLIGNAVFINFGGNSLDGGNPDNLEDLLGQNIFNPNFGYTPDGTGGYSITLCLNPITNLAIVADPAGDFCLGTFVDYNVTFDGGVPSDLAFEWFAYNSGDGSGTSYAGGFIPSNLVQNPTRGWTDSAGSKSVSVTVSQPGCLDETVLYSFEVAENPTNPSLASSSPDSGSDVCVGDDLSATIIPGYDGAGTCVDQIEYSPDSGVTWYAYLSGQIIQMSDQSVIVRGQRICDGEGCDTDPVILAVWYSSPLPEVDVQADKVETCGDSDINLEGNPNGGTGAYTHIWEGSGATSLNDDAFENPLFTESAVGIYDLTYTVEDEKGCKASGDITLEVKAPVINCPDDIVINLNPDECSRVVDFESDITIDDFCDNATLVYVSAEQSGDDFPVGTTTITVKAVDAAGNESEPCSFDIQVIDYISPGLACKNVNISLGSSCEDVLTPKDVLVGWETSDGSALGCGEFYDIEYITPSGETVNTLTGEYIGETLTYVISHASGFTCWGDVLVEDKFLPTVECRDTTVNCLADLSKVLTARAIDNCNPHLELVNEVVIPLNCDPDFIAKVERTYRAYDDYGNYSENCTSTIYLERTDLAGVVSPQRDWKFSCSDNFKSDVKGFGYPDPSVTGSPIFEGKELWPQSQFQQVCCNSMIDYEDVLLIDTKCRKRIMRTWSIVEWWCSTVNEVYMGVQFIDIVDETGPVIPQQIGSNETTGSRSCTASVLLPQLDITDACNEVNRVYVNIENDGSPIGFVNGNGGSAELGVGENIITYTAFDSCNNSSTMSYIITVSDQVEPIALCNENNTVSLNTFGYTEITAESLDNGSFDECGEVTLKIKRMDDPCGTDYDLGWHDKVGFCCLDANTSPMVMLLVTDKGGNTNACMASVSVQDKIQPSMTCPGDITIDDCLFTFDPSESGANHAFGTVTVNDNCPSNYTPVHELVDNRTQCGTGSVVRTWKLYDNITLLQTCTQTITFENNDPFYINQGNPNDPNDDVVWPKDYTQEGQCTYDGLSPESLPEGYGNPVLIFDVCDMIGFNYEDLVMPMTTNGACYKIIRTWTVIDWCQLNYDGTSRRWTYEQTIMVNDNDAPVFVNLPSDKLIYNTINCESSSITLSAEATDCTPSEELVWTYVITKDGDFYISGNSNSLTHIFPVGDYNISFTVHDRCGNINEANYDFEINTIKPATAICKKGLAAELSLVNIGGVDVPQVTLEPEFFDNKSYHECGYDFDLSFSSDLSNQSRTYGCDDVGEQLVQLWTTDENGNTAYCETFVDIQDNYGLCGPTGPFVSNISGRVVSETLEPIANVVVELSGAEVVPAVTSTEGEYEFEPLTNGYSYGLKPNKTDDYMNGISTFDLLLMQRHILSINHLDSPYKMLAADVNNSGTITVADVNELRKLILGLIPSFANNSNWKFLPDNFEFIDSEDPWTGFMPEQYQVNNLNGDVRANFVGIKIGDVDNDATYNDLVGNRTQVRSTYLLAAEDRMVSKGELLEIPVVATLTDIIYGIQGQLVSDGLIIKGVQSEKLSFVKSDYNINAEGRLNMAFVAGQGVDLNSGQAMFTIVAEATKSGKLSEMLYFGTHLNAEIYTGGMKVNNLDINWRNNNFIEINKAGVTPNPWNSTADVNFELPYDGKVLFSVKDYSGRTFVNKVDYFNAGNHSIKLNRNDIPQSGVYLYEIKFGEKVLTGKMIVVE